MAQKHYYILLPLPLFLTILILSLLRHLSWGSTSTSNSSATPQQEYEEWLMWNVKNHGHRRSMIRTTNNAHESKAAALRGSRKSSSTKVLDVKLEKAEMNKMRMVVNPDGTGNFTTITDALNTIPPHNTRRVILDIRPGVYREKIHIPKTKAFITLMGDPKNPPTFTGNDTASVIRGDGTRLSTFHSATVAVDAHYFIALNIIFQNTASHDIGSIGEQAVALRISGSKAAFYNCRFYGSQDTLYDHRGLHYFHNCFIQGSVDFIFGYGRSLYENCTLNSISKRVASVTAQKRTSSTLSSGFSFIDCKVTGSGLVYLGRAWGDYSRVVFSFTFLDKLIIPQGWSNWGNPKRNLSVYYGEYKCSGPGSNITGRVPWARALTDQEVQPFIGPHYVEGETWLISPSTCNYFAFS